MAKRPVVIIFSPNANREVEEARVWWAECGGALALADAVAAALSYIEAFPEAPSLVKIRGKWSTTRRVQVDPIGYHLYYRYNALTGTILVRCFWHQRRRPPRL